MSEKLTHLRDRIDAIDAEIFDLLQERNAVAKQIGELKAEEGLPIRDEKREKALLDAIVGRAEATGESGEYYRMVFEAIIASGRKIQEDLTD